MRTPPQIGVYRITHVESGRYYVGSSVNIKNRWLTHRAELRGGYHGNIRLQNHWNKYGESAFTWQVLEEFKTLQDARQREQLIIDAERPFLNMCQVVGAGSGAQVGHVVSAETRAKISAAQKGKPRNPESVAKMAASRRGMVQSAETRRKRSLSMIGKNKGRILKTHCVNGHLLSTNFSLKAKRVRPKCASCHRQREHERRLRLKQALVSTI